MDGIERYFLEQKHARLLELQAKLSHRIGRSAAFTIADWYAAVHDIGCPNCGIDFATMHPAANLWPHFTGDCAEKN